MNPNLDELACLYVLDQLDTREREAFEARMDLEPEIRTLVGEAESALARRVDALPKHIPSDFLLADIEARLGGNRKSRADGVLPWASAARWGLAAVIALCLCALAVQRLVRVGAAPGRPSVILVGLDPSQSLPSTLQLHETTQDPDARFIQLASLASHLWENRGGATQNRARTQNGRGYALYDPASSQGFIAVQQLPAAEAGRLYHLWIVDTASGSVREVGALPLSPLGSGLYSFTVAVSPKASPEHLDFVVTAEDEQVSNPTKPAGRVVLGKERVY